MHLAKETEAQSRSSVNSTEFLSLPPSCAGMSRQVSMVLFGPDVQPPSDLLLPCTHSKFHFQSDSTGTIFAGTSLPIEPSETEGQKRNGCEDWEVAVKQQLRFFGARNGWMQEGLLGSTWASVHTQLLFLEAWVHGSGTLPRGCSLPEGSAQVPHSSGRELSGFSISQKAPWRPPLVVFVCLFV